MTEEGKKDKFVRYKDGAKMYHMGKTKFQIVNSSMAVRFSDDLYSK